VRLALNWGIVILLGGSPAIGNFEMDRTKWRRREGTGGGELKHLKSLPRT